MFGTPEETLAFVFDILHLALGKIDNGHKKGEQKKGEKLKEKGYFKTEGMLASRKTHLKRGNCMERCLMQSKLTTILQASQPSMLSSTSGNWSGVFILTLCYGCLKKAFLIKALPVPCR